ncbi:MAG: putative component of type VI protein secretion system [Candidatus Omnitrophota bacterium]|jgi:predicted component of type VI protein secretion system
MSQETFKLLFTNGPREGDQIPLGDSITTLGRSKRNTIILDDPSISREHLRFYVDDDTVSVEDTGSSRGTLLNGQALTSRMALKHGDELDVGKQQIKIVSLNQSLDGDEDMTIFHNFEEIEEKFNSEIQVDFKQVKVRVEGKTAEAPPEPAPTNQGASAPAPVAPAAEEDDRTRVLDANRTRAFNAGEVMDAVNAGVLPPLNSTTAPRKNKAIPLLAGLILVLALTIAGVYIYQTTQGGAPPANPTAAVAGWDYQPVRVVPEEWNTKVAALNAEGWTLSSEPKMETDADGKAWMVSLFKKAK